MSRRKIEFVCASGGGGGASRHRNAGDEKTMTLHGISNKHSDRLPKLFHVCQLSGMRKCALSLYHFLPHPNYIHFPFRFVHWFDAAQLGMNLFGFFPEKKTERTLHGKKRRCWRVDDDEMHKKCVCVVVASCHSNGPGPDHRGPHCFTLNFHWTADNIENEIHDI